MSEYVKIKRGTPLANLIEEMIANGEIDLPVAPFSEAPEELKEKDKNHELEVFTSIHDLESL